MKAAMIAIAYGVLLAGSSLRPAVPATPAAEPSSQSAHSGKAVLKAFISAWNRHDFAAFDVLLAPDAVYEDIAWDLRGQGVEQIKGLMRDMIASEPDYSWRLTSVIGTGLIVAAEWTWTATYTGDLPPPCGHVVRLHSTARGVAVAEIENGKIKALYRLLRYGELLPQTFSSAPASKP
jgi:steroid delta-isomerase-like uncharacterized protein